MIKIELIRVSNREISIILDDRSSCSLESNPNYELFFKQRLNLESSSPIFWFNRLKVNNYNEGRGTFLMKKLSEVLDENKYAVFNHVNPYGPLSLDQLIAFYQKYQFKTILQPNGMFREPSR